MIPGTLVRLAVQACSLLGCSLAVSGCAQAPHASGDPPRTLPASVETLAYEAPVGAVTWFFAHVEATAVCVLHGAGSPSTSGLPLVADANGWLRMGVSAPTLGTVATAAFDCTAPDGSVVLRTMSIRALPASAVPAHNPSPPPVDRTVIPALEGDPMALDPQELAARGYPPRPDPVSAPGRYAEWRNAVSTPSYIPRVDPVPTPTTTIAAMAGVSPSRARPAHGGSDAGYGCNGDYPGWSPYWSGAALDNGPYAQVGATWTVPSVSYDPAAAFDVYTSSAWEGLGNHPNLIQAGTEQDGTWTQVEECYFPPHPPDCHEAPFFATNYYAWTESGGLNHGQGNGTVFPATQYPLFPGDTIVSETFICSSNKTPDANGNYGCMYVNDTTQGWATGTQILSIGGPASTVSYSAEWIMERSTPSPAPAAWGVSNYGSIVFSALNPSPAPRSTNQFWTMVDADCVPMSVASWESDGDLKVTFEQSF